MTRREAAEKVFKYIRKNKFEPIDIKYHSFSLLDDGEDYMVQFYIKGLRGWKFGMWIETDEAELKREENRRDGKDYPAVQFFCQHKLNIDKFRPSSSFHLVDLSLEDIKEDKPWSFCYIRDVLRMIKRHPLVAFAMDAYEDCYCDESYLGCYLDMMLFSAKKKIKKWWNDALVKVWHGSKVWFINRYKVVDKATLIDKGKSTYSRYDMEICFKPISDDKDIQQRAEVEILNRWFRKNHYNNMDLTLRREGVKGSYIYSMSR